MEARRPAVSMVSEPMPSAGSLMVKRVPRPGVLSTEILPLCAFTIDATKLRPRPKPCSGPAAEPIWGAVKAVENVRQRLGRDAPAGIFHDDRHVIRTVPHFHPHFPAARSELNGIRQQVGQHALDLDTVHEGGGTRPGRSAVKRIPAPSAGIWNWFHLVVMSSQGSSAIFEALTVRIRLARAAGGRARSGKDGRCPARR